MTLPTSMPYLLDVSLPPSSSQSSDVDMRIYEASPCTTVGLHDMNEETTDLCATCPVPASSSSKRPSLPPSGFPRTFLSERGGVDPVDWPPIGSIPLCSDRNVRQYDGVVVQTKENTDILIVLQNTRPTPARELNENRPNYASHTSYNSPDRSLAQTPDQRLASFDKHPSALPFPEPCNKSPVITTFFSSFLAPPTSERRVNIEGRDSSQQGCDDITSISTRLDPRVELPQQPRLRELELPPFPSLPPFSLSPSTFLQSLRRHTASFLARISSSSSVTGDTPPHSLYNDLSSSIQSRERHLTGDGLVAPLDGIRSTTTPAVTGFSVRNQDDLQAVPPQREFSLPFNNTAGFGGAMSSWNSSSNFSLPAHPLLGCLEGFTWGLDSLEVGRPSGLFSVLSEQRGPVLKRDSISTAIPSPLEARGEPPVISDPLEPLLGSKISRYNIDELSRVPSPGSRPSHIAADLQKRDTWMQSCLPVSLGQSCDVALIQSDLVPTASSSPSNHLFAPGPAAIGPLKWDGREANSSVPVVSFRWEDTEARVLNTKRITKSSLRAPLPRLLPGLLDPDYKEWAHHIDESPCASERPPKGRRANQYRVISRPRDIRKLDYGLPEDLVPSSGVFSLKRLDPDLDVSACIIPSDCPTSTPVASRKQTGGGSHACVERPDSQGSMASRKMKEQALLPGETVYPPDPIFDFFGI
ncbi:hypothetical protein F5148DRAFT_1183214 [Russula earlei]|uniref:Uncharacterized protein n=1 Tax=Russula earlei TaxID=71964 RepID=A0ACC0UGM8_9AGAM|nr:hypothetical protein F5148DRAFT_1183214 [Russula earlei]